MNGVDVYQVIDTVPDFFSNTSFQLLVFCDTWPSNIPGNIIRIERSADGINFETVSTIGALGSSDQKTYSWNDYNPLSGNNFYRLVLNNPSGSSLISKTVSVIKQRAIYDLAEGPNPFISSFKFSINLDKADKVSYSILDMVSNTLVSGQYEGQPGMNNFTIDNLNNLSAGNYILQVIVSEKRYFKKIVKKYWVVWPLYIKWFYLFVINLVKYYF